MAKYSSRFNAPATIGVKLENGSTYVDYKNADDLRRLLSANGKLISRQRTRLNSQHQRLAAQAVKRARFMAMIPQQSSYGAPRS